MAAGRRHRQRRVRVRQAVRDFSPGIRAARARVRNRGLQAGTEPEDPCGIYITLRWGIAALYAGGLARVRLDTASPHFTQPQGGGPASTMCDSMVTE